MPAGYSGTPLAKKLGISEGNVVAVLGEPDDFRGLLAPIPDAVRFRTSARGRANVVVAFFVRRADFEHRLAAVGRAIFPDGGLWIAWPITEDVVREVALPTGLGRQQGLRHRRHLVGPAHRVAQGASLW